MKKLKFVAIALCLGMLLTACNIVNVTEAATTNNSAILKNHFLYYLELGKSQALKLAQDKKLTISKDSDWNTVQLEGVTAAEYAKNKAIESFKQTYVLAAKANELGITLTPEDEATVTSNKNQIIKSTGGRYDYKQFFADLGITDADLTEIVRTSVLAGKVGQKYNTDESFTTVTDEEIAKTFNEKYAKAKHILISTKQNENTTTPTGEGATAPEGVITGEGAALEQVPAAEDIDATAKAKAEDILTRLKNGENFDTLMKEFSEDPGMTSNPTGYVFTKGEMVKEFEDATFALKVGEFTQELVKSDYGYHIIMRVENPAVGADFDSKKDTVKQTALTDKFENLINSWAEEIGFKLNEKVINSINVVG